MAVEWKVLDGELKPFCEGRPVVWAAQPGAQRAFLDCPLFECLLEGTRGGGKTDALLMDFLQHVGRGFKGEWRGILFRQTFPQLQDVVIKTKKWFPRIFPSAGFNNSTHTWAFASGETLRLAYMDKEDDYWTYHGSSWPWIGWEELTTWKDDKCYRVMMSCCRSTAPRMPRKYRATTNPYGPGHNWVKSRWSLPVVHGKRVKVLDTDPLRCSVHSDLDENQVLVSADPTYRRRLEEAARNPSEKAAWLEGSWDIVSGGMFDDVWAPAHHLVPDPFPIPSGWRINRSYDHGQSRPFSVGWWAESNGEPIQVGKRLWGTVPGDLFRIGEWYGWNTVPNEGLRMASGDIGRGILDRETGMGLKGRVRIGPADSSIFTDFEPGKSVAGEMGRVGVRWEPADKGPGSRKQGWQQIREMLKAAIPKEEGARERPGFFVFSSCEQFLRTVPTLPRGHKDLDDVDTDSEDHIGDEVRYRVREKLRTVTCKDM